jgi:hypothetical protein
MKPTLAKRKDVRGRVVGHVATIGPVSTLPLASRYRERRGAANVRGALQRRT